MKLMSSEWEKRIGHWIRTLKEDLYEPLGEISWEAFCTMEHLPLKSAMQGPFRAVKPGFTWGHTWEYCWMKAGIILPERAEGERIVLDLNPGGESTLFVNGVEFGTYRADWIDQRHQYIEDNTIAFSGKSGEQYEILMETYAGHYFPDTHECAVGPVLPGAYQDPLPEGARRTLGYCTFGIWNEEAYQLYMDVDTLYKLLEGLEKTSLRASKVAKALQQFTLTVEFEQEKEARILSYRKAREELRPVLEAVNGSTVPQFYAIGNSHLDLAWLWPMAETHRKTARTFAAQLRLMEEYPEYKYLQSQPASYEMCRKYYPKLFEKIKEAVKKGQWIAEGAMWVEPDTNISGGEALIRQLLLGRQYYKDEFGVESEILWLPDSFGYSAALPQILKGCRVKYLVTQKIFWSYNEGERFPYHYFNWEGMDGSQIISFLPTGYTFRTDPKRLNEAWEKRVQSQDLESFLIPFGYGDGGGGPARDFVEYLRREENLEGCPKVKIAGPSEFFEEMRRNQGDPVNTWVGELYFCAHRGTYTSQAKVKQNNRRAEFGLREAELWGSVAQKMGFPYPYEKMDALWKELLLNQFHDILPGSSLGRVYRETEASVERVIEEVKQEKKAAIRAIMENARESQENDGITLFNSLGFERSAVVKIPERFADGAVTAEGKAIPVQKAGKEVKALVRIPSCGTLSLYPKEEHTCMPRARIYEDEDGYRMENEKLTAKINRKGEVVSFILKESEREFSAGIMNRFHLYKDVPRLYDAWDIDSNYREQEVEGVYDVKTEIAEEGLEAVLKVTGKISNSAYTQQIRLSADSERLEFETRIDWKELHRLLKVAFPVDVYSEEAMNEIQFGYVKRPTHRSGQREQDRYEVCNHRYTALADEVHGAAVLNDCKYGISMNGNALELTLLRAPASPEMRADNRVHEFTYAFTAWEGSFGECNVVNQGYELNTKPEVVEGGAPAFEALRVEKSNVILETVKPAQDQSGDVILRLYEAKKAAVITEILCRIGKQAFLCDMMENVLEEIPFEEGKMNLSFRAFEIKTIRIRG